VGNRIVPSPDLEPDGNYEKKDHEHQQRLKIFDYSYKVHPTTLSKPFVMADKDFGLQQWLAINHCCRLTEIEAIYSIKVSF
jgi:hypothetical protein